MQPPAMVLTQGSPCHVTLQPQPMVLQLPKHVDPTARHYIHLHCLDLAAWHHVSCIGRCGTPSNPWMTWRSRTITTSFQMTLLWLRLPHTQRKDESLATTILVRLIGCAIDQLWRWMVRGVGGGGTRVIKEPFLFSHFCYGVSDDERLKLSTSLSKAMFVCSINFWDPDSGRGSTNKHENLILPHILLVEPEKSRISRFSLSPSIASFYLIQHTIPSAHSHNLLVCFSICAIAFHNLTSR